MMMMKKKKPKGKWFWVIWCRNELFALALLTSNWYALESFHLTFELNCDSFRNHFIIHTYIPVYLPLISVASVCWLLFFASAWYRFVLSCSAFIFIHSHVATNLRWAYFLSVFGPLLFWFYPATHPMTLTYVLCGCGCGYAIHIISTLAHCTYIIDDDDDDDDVCWLDWCVVP